MTAERDDAPVTTAGALVKTINRPQSTPPIHVSLSLKRLLVDLFDAETLRTLAWQKEHENPGWAARQSLSDASVDQLADMLTAGRKPTIGWWTRHLEVVA